jgi:hypothetical protein
MLVRVPVRQASVSEGVVAAYLPFLVPQEPLMGVLFREAVQESSVPPLEPTQVQLVEEPSSGKEGEEGLAVPCIQKVSEPYVVSE